MSVTVDNLRANEVRKLDTAEAMRRIIVALDVDNEMKAMNIVRALRDDVSFYKIGLELFSSVGPKIVRTVRDAGADVFLDCKYMDIPATVSGAVRAAARIGVRFVNVHCFGGKTMIAAAAEAIRTGTDTQVPPKLLGVTVLTSLDSSALADELNVRIPVSEQVVHLARCGVEAGLDGVIASPQETNVLRRVLPASALIVTPGVRPTWASVDDQRRTATPAQAIRDGADFLVIGRPITRPPQHIGSPQEALRLIASEMSQAV